MLDKLENRFKNRTKNWLQKDLQKHVNYLQKVVLKGMEYHKDDFEKALQIFQNQPDKGVDLIYQCLKDALEEKHSQQMQKGERIVQAYKKGHIEIEKDGNSVTVESETTAGKNYTVDMSDFSCECQSGQKLSYSGLCCKHACAVFLLFGETDEKKETRETTAVLVSELEIVHEASPERNRSSFIVYQNQKLRIRKKTPNSQIPPKAVFFLEGKAPEMTMYALENNQPLLLIGESGTGKSKMIQALAHATNTPLMAPCGHAEATVEHLLGCFIARDGSTIWRNGVIPTAMRQGYWLMLEEVNAIDPAVLKILNELLDSQKITLTIAGKPKVISADEKFRIICSSNPPDNPIYRGIEPMSFEFFDRFSLVVKMDYLSCSAEKAVIKELAKFNDSEILDKMVKFANRVREAMKNNEIFATVTTRSLVQWAKLIPLFGVKNAAQTSILNKFDQQSYLKAIDLLSALFS